LFSMKEIQVFAALRYFGSFVTRYPFANAVIINEFQETKILSSNPGETLIERTFNNFSEQDFKISLTLSSGIPKLKATEEILILLHKMH